MERESSILGYPYEISQPLNADHHNICKYKSSDDGNYISVRDTLRLWASRIGIQSKARLFLGIRLRFSETARILLSMFPGPLRHHGLIIRRTDLIESPQLT